MDGSRFDDLTRALTVNGSRRRVITSLASVALGLVGFRRADARRCTAAGTICREHADCCSGTCGPKDRYGRRQCGCGSARDCPPANQQCQIATCDGGVCGLANVKDQTECDGGVCLNGVCNTTCTQVEGECNSNDDCCSGICQSETCVSTVAGTCTTGSGTCGNGDCGCIEISGTLTCADSGLCGGLIQSQADCEEGTYFVSPSPFCGGDNGCLRPPCLPFYDSCFTGETRIAMADGTSKPIDQITIGELVLGQNGVNRVVEIERPRLGSRRLYALNEGPFFVTAEHPFLTEDGWKSVNPAATAAENPALIVGRLAIGDRLLSLVGARVPALVGGAEICEEEPRPDLASVTLGSLIAISADPETPLYNLRLDGDHAYFANELLVHNK